MCSHLDAASPSSSHNVGAAFRRSIRKEIQGCVRSNVRIFVQLYYSRKLLCVNGKCNQLQSICPRKCPRSVRTPAGLRVSPLRKRIVGQPSKVSGAVQEIGPVLSHSTFALASRAVGPRAPARGALFVRFRPKFLP